ncbi:MAG: hypothetical protein QOJ29_1615 [Thermoleophilaceae bacterium]|jgi:hypothetical protein|nr:hypothetical protein [Thermoleophilaceae bacterium]
MEPEEGTVERAPWAKRVGLAALMAIVATNVWVGGPLLALWIGSRLQEHSGGSLTIRPATALAVFASLAAITVGLIKLLSIVSSAYDRACGVGPAKRRHDSWVSVERKTFPGQRPSLTTLERILVVVVAMAAIAFDIWFFFYSTSPIDQRSGRGSVPLAQLPPPGRLEPANTKNQISNRNAITMAVVMNTRSH